MIVNWDVGNAVNGDDPKMLQKAFESWSSAQNKGYKWGPIKHIPKAKVRKWISLIGGTYPFAVHEALKFIKQSSLEESTKWPQVVRDDGNQRYYLEYDSEKQVLEISFRRKKTVKRTIKKPGWWEMVVNDQVFLGTFDYCVKFYLTKKTLKSLGIKTKKWKKKGSEKKQCTERKRIKFPRTRSSKRSY